MSIFLLRTRAITALCLLFMALDGVSQDAKKPTFTSAAAVAAFSKREHIVSQAKLQFVAALKVALAGVMQGGQLDEANRINKIIESPDVEESLTSLRGKAAQTAYRSAVQRATNEYLLSLKAALGQSMKAGQLEESNRITAEVKSIAEAIAARANTTPGFLNLLALIEPEKGTIKGKYELEKGALISSGKGEERQEIPYEVPEEYDYQISFTKDGGDAVVVQMLSGNGHPFIWAMNSGGSFTFHYLKGSGIGANKTTVKTAAIKNGKRYAAILKVRKNGVQAFVDGKLVSKWDTDFSDSTPAHFWAMRNQKALGVGNGAAKITFHSIEVREVTGKGQVLK